MRFYFNRQPVIGPWGGGNALVTELARCLIDQGHNVSYDINSRADVYVCFDPRPNNAGVTGRDIVHHSRLHDGKLCCRVGDIGTHGKPELPVMWGEVIQHADVVVFPSEFARRHVPTISRICDKLQNSHVIWNGVRRGFVNGARHRPAYDGLRPLRIVTHHWSDNVAKGFDIYELVDHISQRELYEFTYIGRAPQTAHFTRHIQPLGVAGLAAELPKHDLYLTASKAEAGANHVLEAMSCGLPVVYHEQGGSIVEYCASVGESFDGTMESLADAVRKCMVRLRDRTDIINTPMLQVIAISTIVDRYIELLLG